jgi:hypothetical protein
MPTIPEAKTFAVFSLFFWRSTFAKAALVLAAFAAVSVAFAIVKGKIAQKTEEEGNDFKISTKWKA